MARANLNATVVPANATPHKSSWTAQQARGASPVLYKAVTTVPREDPTTTASLLPKSTVSAGLDQKRFPDIWYS